MEILVKFFFIFLLRDGVSGSLRSDDRSSAKVVGPRTEDYDAMDTYRKQLYDEIFYAAFETTKTTPPGDEQFQAMYRQNKKSATLTSKLYRVEVAVVVEDEVVAKYGEHLKNFVQATFAEVDRIFSKTELGIALEVHVTKLVKMSEVWSEKLRGGSNLEETRKKFCFWQRNFFTDRTHVDVAVYIRSNPMQNPGSGKGYTELGMMCSHEASCIVVDDMGLESYRIIVQQIAFLMNIPFDGESHEMRRAGAFMEKLRKKSEEVVTAINGVGRFYPNSQLDELGLKLLLLATDELLYYMRAANEDSYFDFFSQFQDDFLYEVKHYLRVSFHESVCDEQWGRNYVMTPMEKRRRYNLHTTISWSKCSQEAVKDFLLAGEKGVCLLNEPTRLFERLMRKPGEIFDNFQQCRYLFGADFVAENSTRPDRICSQLLCKLSNKISSLSISMFPPAYGTYCDSGQICMDGRCLPPPTRNQRAIGQWGSWTAWSTLDHSKKCGVKVEESERRCEVDGHIDSNYCFGEKVRFRVARSYENCHPYKIDRFCPILFHRPFSSQEADSSVVERDYDQIEDDDVCRLNCRNNQLGKTFSTRMFVEDGSRCGPDTDDICIRGRCVSLRCNDTLGGAVAVFQPCDSCLSAGEDCTRIENRFTSGVVTSREDLMTYDTGSASINITMAGRSKISEEGLQSSDKRYMVVLKNADNQQLIFDPYYPYPRWFRISQSDAYVHYSGANSIVKRMFISKKLTFPIQLEIRGHDIGDIDPYEAIVTSSHYVITQSSDIN